MPRVFRFVVDDVFRLSYGATAVVGEHPSEGAFTSGQLVDIVRDGDVVATAIADSELHTRPGQVALRLRTPDVDVRPGDEVCAR